VHRRQRRVAVVGVDEQPVGQHLDALPHVGEGIEVARLLVGVEAQLEHLAGAVLLDEAARAALRDDAPLVHDDEAVAQLLGLVHVVRRDDEGHALALEPEEPVPQDVPRLRVQPGRRLVEEQHLGVVDQAAGDRQAPLHPSGQRLDPVVAALGELREVQQGGGSLAHLGAGEPEEPAVHVQVVLDGEVLVEDVLLRAHPQAARIAGPSDAGSRPRIAAHHRWPARRSRSSASCSTCRRRWARGNRTPRRGAPRRRCRRPR
jgi:hypothetical protein